MTNHCKGCKYIDEDSDGTYCQLTGKDLRPEDGDIECVNKRKE